MIPGKRIPLTVIGGFLGAGKTTLLNRLLKQAHGHRLAVLVNDFGALNIDAELVSARGADAIALSNGCVCCAIGDDLSAALIRVLDATPPFDALVIEASGVADPWRIAQVGLTERGLSLGGVVVLVDASAVLGQIADPLLTDSLLRQVHAADWLLLNKTDLVDGEKLSRVRSWIADVAPDTVCFETRSASLPPVLSKALFGELGEKEQGSKAGPISGCADHVHDGSHHGPHRLSHASVQEASHGTQFETASWQPREVLSAERLRALLRQMPAGVLRLKGIVRTDRHGWAELQFAGRHGSLRKALRVPDCDAAVVAIGLLGRLPTSALDAVFGATAAT